MLKIDWLPVTRFEQNCSIMWCDVTRKAAVVDPGGDLYSIQTFLELEELEVEAILVTHGHFDHAGAAKPLSVETGAPIYGPHIGDKHLVEGLHDHGEFYGLRAENYTPERWLTDGDRIQVGRELVQVLHCPGHTRGHVAYFNEPSRFAWVGDILFQNTIGAWSHRDGDLMTLIRSIRGKLFPLGDNVQFLPGHGETSTFGQERRANPFVGDSSLAVQRLGRNDPLVASSFPAELSDPGT